VSNLPRSSTSLAPIRLWRWYTADWD
jgi:hypothetical protein